MLLSDAPLLQKCNVNNVYTSENQAPLRVIKKVRKFVQNFKKWNLCGIEKEEEIQPEPRRSGRKPQQRKSAIQVFNCQNSFGCKLAAENQSIDSYAMNTVIGRKRAGELEDAPVSKNMLRKKKRQKKAKQKLSKEKKTKQTKLLDFFTQK